MHTDKVYWFEQPKLPGCYSIAVSPRLAPEDYRLHFSVPGSGTWALAGELVSDDVESFVFKCDYAVMGARGGTYRFQVLTLETFREMGYQHVARGREIAESC